MDNTTKKQRQGRKGGDHVTVLPWPGGQVDGAIENDACGNEGQCDDDEAGEDAPAGDPAH